MFRFGVVSGTFPAQASRRNTYEFEKEARNCTRNSRRPNVGSRGGGETSGRRLKRVALDSSVSASTFVTVFQVSSGRSLQDLCLAREFGWLYPVLAIML